LDLAWLGWKTYSAFVGQLPQSFYDPPVLSLAFLLLDSPVLADARSGFGEIPAGGSHHNRR
jgi:hypothetical protein